MPVSTTPPGYPSACNGALDYVAFRYLNSVGTRNNATIVAQWLAYAYPCQRFATHLAARHA